MRKIIIISCFIYPLTGLSQIFNWESKLEKPASTGFYRITLDPEISTHLDNQFGNIRITNNQNTEIPYLFQTEAPGYYSQLFYEYEIVEKRVEQGCCTFITLQNEKRNKINNISLLIKNAEVIKNATLYGSYNNQDRFILKQNFKLYNINNQQETSELKILDFPLSDYLYYTIKIEDSLSAPLNILKAGYYNTFFEKGKYATVPFLKYAQTDSISKKKSYVKIVFEQESLLDKLEISIKGSPFFLRKAILYVPQERKTRKGAKEYYLKELAKTELSSVNENSFILPALKIKELLLVIDNEDNPPLTIDSVKGFQLNRYLVTWLEKDKEYALKLGDDKINMPKYDISYFKDSIPGTIPTLAYGEIQSIKKEEIKAEISFFTNKNIIWIAIIIVILILGSMSIKMIKETAEKNNN